MSRQHSTGRLVAGALAVVVAVVALSTFATGPGTTAAPMHHAASGHAMSGHWFGLGLSGAVWWLLLAAVIVGVLAVTQRDGDD